MIYFDNAATSFPKPKEVIEAVNNCLTENFANPGRSGHWPALRASRAVYGAREKIAEFFCVDDPLRIIFTSGTTESLNLAIKGSLKKGDHVITSSMEHNSVLRPISRLKEEGVEATIIECSVDGFADVSDFEGAIKANTKMVVCTHASNVTGTIMPVREIGGMCRKHGILFTVDAAQSAGFSDIDAEDMNIDLLAVPGHKGIMGIQGTGILYIGSRADVVQLTEGGTGSNSEQIVQPTVLPDRYESGTLNLPGIVSFGAGISVINDIGLDRIREHKQNLTSLFLEGVKNIKGAVVYGHDRPAAPVVSVNLDNIGSSEFAYKLDEEFGICTRAGLHCAPLAHRTIGTTDKATVRFSFGYHNTKEEIAKSLDAIYKISAGRY